MGGLNKFFGLSKRKNCRFTVAVALTIVAGLVTGCGTIDGTALREISSGTSQLTANFGSLAEYETQKLNWKSCDDWRGENSEAPRDRMECTAVTVPLDYANLRGEKATIAVMRLKASGEKIGSLFTNPGGPGGSGVEYLDGQASSLVKMEIATRFDIVGFDPRGVGRSTPTVRCLTDSERDADRKNPLFDTSVAGIAAMEKRNQLFAAKCVERSGKSVLAHVGTIDVVRDLDVLRAALGDGKLNYIGFSYGTLIGSTYAEMFPQKVRTMINDGVVNPAANKIDEAIKQYAGFQNTFQQFALDCVKQKDCVFSSAESATAKIQSLLRPLQLKPISTKDGRGLNFSDAVTGVIQTMYSNALWKYLRTGLEQLTKGNGELLLKLADLYLSRDSSGKYSNQSDVFTAINCMDSPAITDPVQLGRMDTAIRRAAPFIDDGRGSGRGARDSCAFWSTPPTMKAHPVSAPGLPFTVVVSTINDPATPYLAGVELAKALKAGLITINGADHTGALQGNKCVDEPITKYLVNLTPPAANLRCEGSK